MKIVLRIIFLIIAIILSLQKVSAQLTMVNEPDKPSVQAAEMTKYGKLNAQLYTGKVSVSIPIYVYRDSRFSVPISLYSGPAKLDHYSFNV